MHNQLEGLVFYALGRYLESVDAAFRNGNG
jgi:hypothetical protein